MSEDKNKLTKLDFSKMSNYFKKDGKGIKLVFIVGLAGIILIGLSSVFSKKSTEKPIEELSSKTAEQYTKELEEKVSELMTNIDGVGNARVMVTLENGVEYIYATEKRINSDKQEDEFSKSERDDTEQSIIIIDRGNGKEGLVVTELQPTIKGVVVICEGGDLETVKDRVTDMITTIFNISSKRVCVIKLST